MVIERPYPESHGVQGQRTGSRSDGARFTVETFARHFVDDPIHHLCHVHHPAS